MRGWTWEIARNGKKRTIKVEVSGTLDGSNRDLAENTRKALRTSGRSAVHTVLYEDEPPKKLNISTHGIHWE